LKESFEFGEMMRRTHENVLAEMLEKVLAYNISGDHPDAEEAFRATRGPTGTSLKDRTHNVVFPKLALPRIRPVMG
jgi:hypothetical protein